MELIGGGWSRNPGEVRPITGDGTGEPVKQETGQKEPERKPLQNKANTTGKQVVPTTARVIV